MTRPDRGRRGPRRPPRRAEVAHDRPALARSAAPGALAALVMRAQLLGLVRDRRALIAAFVLPVALYPLLFLGNSWLQRLSAETLEARQVRIALDATRAPAEIGSRLRAALEACEPVEVVAVDGAPVADDWDWMRGPESNGTALRFAQDLLSQGFDALVVTLPAERGLQAASLCWYDGTRDVSNEAQRRVHAASGALRDELADARRLALLGHDPARGLSLSPIDVAESEDRGGAELGRWLPLLAVFVLLAGASHAALSGFAAEREAGTLETLLVQPVPSGSIVAGKFAAVLATGVATLVLNAGSVITCLALGLGRLPGSHADQALALDAGRVALGALAFLPAAVLVCAVLCLVCGRARSFREGQNLLLPLLLVAIVPTLPALQPDVRLDPFLAAVPLCGPSLVLRDTLSGSASLPLALWMLVANAAWAGLALLALSRALDAERLLQDAENEEESERRRLQSRTAVRWAVVVVFAVYLVGGWLQGLHAAWGLLATLYGILPVAAWLSARGTARRARTSVVAVLQLRWPNPAHALAALALAPAVALAARELFEVQQRFLPLPRGVEELSLPLEIAGLSAAAQVALLALSPALCEELFFRGALLDGLRRDLGLLRTLAWQALLFGAVHASIHRFLPTGLLGALLAVLALRTRSLLPAVLLHAGYNAILVLSDRVPELSDPRLAWAALFAPLLLAARPRGSGPT